MLLLFLACSPQKDSPVPQETEPPTDTVVDSEPPSPPDGTVTATLSFDDGTSATLVAWHAFSYANGKAAMVYLSSAPDATCDALVASLFQQATPESLYVAGACNLQIVVNGPLPLDYDFASGSKAPATFQLSCPFGSGSFAQNGNAWRWSGDWWVGNADGGTVSLTAEGDAVAGTLNLSSFPGSYPYKTGTPKANATGPVAGLVIPEGCPALSSHPIFQ